MKLIKYSTIGNQILRAMKCSVLKKLSDKLLNYKYRFSSILYKKKKKKMNEQISHKIPMLTNGKGESKRRGIDAGIMRILTKTSSKRS